MTPARRRAISGGALLPRPWYYANSCVPSLPSPSVTRTRKISPSAVSRSAPTAGEADAHRSRKRLLILSKENFTDLADSDRYRIY
jgi:hypothetical protein